MTRRRTTKEFIDLSNQIHGNKYDYSLVEYKNKEKKVDIICPIHGIFSQRAGLHLLGSGCPKCSYVYRSNLCKKTLNEFIIEAKKIHNDFFSYEKFNYINSHTKSIIICPIHGEFEQNPNDHLQGKGCPKCNMSFLEKEIFSFLVHHSIKFDYQKKFDWLGKQSLDFYLPQYKIGIECQGKQHFGCGGWSDGYDFFNQKERDERKQKLCKENNVEILYFSHFPTQYDEFYTDENTFNSVETMFFKKIGLKQNTWSEELLTYFTNLVKGDCKKDKLEVFNIDLTNNSEKNVPNNFEMNRLKFNRIGSKMTFHIFEDEWLYKKEIVKSRINNILNQNSRKIYARNCDIRFVDKKESNEFLEKNHIQGNVNGKYNLGLYYQDELVSFMSFGNLRKNLGSNACNNEYELLRFCNKLNTSVVGGASKLLNFFKIKYKPIKIISYCDLRWSDGKMYEILGFTLSHISRPNYFYINQDKKIRENRFKYRKDILVKDGFDKNKSEHEIMLERGIYRIYDCGCKVYILK